MTLSLYQHGSQHRPPQYREHHRLMGRREYWSQLQCLSKHSHVWYLHTQLDSSSECVIPLHTANTILHYSDPCLSILDQSEYIHQYNSILINRRRPGHCHRTSSMGGPTIHTQDHSRDCMIGGLGQDLGLARQSIGLLTIPFTEFAQFSLISCLL